MDTVPSEADVWLLGGGNGICDVIATHSFLTLARLAQPVERKALNLVVVGSSPTVGVSIFGGVCFLCRRACSEKH